MTKYAGKTELVGVGWIHGARECQRVYYYGNIWKFYRVGSSTSWLVEVKGSILEYLMLVFNRFKRRKVWTTDSTSASKKKPEYVTLSPL